MKGASRIAATLLCAGLAVAAPSIAGFDFPLGKPNGNGYGPGFGGLIFLEQDDYGGNCGVTFHPGEDWNADGSGQDFGGDGNDANDPVYAVSDGEIEFAEFRSNSWGDIVLVRHNGNFTLPEGGSIATVWSQYGHLASISTNPRTGQIWKKGEKVFRGEQLGTVGDYPNGSGQAFHLHFEIRKKKFDAFAFPCGERKSTVEEKYTRPSAFIALNRQSVNSPRYTFFMESFSITKNNALFFEDKFTSGTPPPEAPNFVGGNPASYFVVGTVGPEAGGKLTIDSAGAIVVGSVPPGGHFLIQQVPLVTNRDPNDFTRGLKIVDTFSVTGVFDLAVPDDLVEGYGIAFSDATATSLGRDYLRLYVRQRLGITLITFAHIDRTIGTFTVLATVPLEPNHSQIALTLSRPVAGDNRVVASYAYIDGGIPGPGADLTAMGEIFRGENFTRALFFAESRLP